MVLFFNALLQVPGDITVSSIITSFDMKMDSSV